MENDPPGARAPRSPRRSLGGVPVGMGLTNQPPPASRVSFPAFLAVAEPALHQAFWLVVFLAGTFAFCYLAKRRRTLLNHPLDPWADAEAVDNIMVLAMDQNVTMSFRPKPGGPDLPPVSGAGVSLDGHSLSVQCAGQMPPEHVRAWTGQEVEVSFSVSVGHKTRIFRFDSAVLHATGSNAAPILELARPLRLAPFQRRTWPRICPPPSLVLGMGLWDAARPQGAPSALPAPLLSYHPPQAESMRLAGISSSGLSLRVSRRNARAIPSSCLLFLSLRHGRSKTMHLWLACARRHATALAGRNTALVGLEFTEWSRVERADADIAWKRVGGNGEVPPLKNWIVRHEAAERRASARYVNL